MLEAGVALAISAVTGMAVLTNRLHTRINHLDQRVDTVELRVAQEYVSKADLSEMMSRVEDHMVRIENKLDKLTFDRR